MRTFGVASLLCLLTVTPAAAAWTQIQTPHYLFIADASAGDMRQIVRRFEQFHAVMRGAKILAVQAWQAQDGQGLPARYG